MADNIKPTISPALYLQRLGSMGKRSFSEAITLKTRQGKGMSFTEAIGYLREQIGSLETQKHYVHGSEHLDATERMRMVSALSSKIYAIHCGYFVHRKRN